MATATKKNLFKTKATSGPKSGDSKPVVQVTDPATVAAIAEALRCKKESEELKVLGDAHKDQAVAGLRSLYYEACLQRGEAASTVALHVEGKPVAKLTSQCMYVGADPERAAEIRGVFPDEEEYARYFKDQLKLSVKKDSAGDDSFLEQLQEKCGEAFLEKHFEWSTKIVPTKALHADLVLRPDVRERCAPLVQGKIINQYSPSIQSLGDKE